MHRSACSKLSHILLQHLVMTRTIAQRESRNDKAKVIAAVTAGEAFVVTSNGEPVAELRPSDPAAAPSSPVRRSRRWPRPGYESTDTDSEPTSTA